MSKFLFILFIVTGSLSVVAQNTFEAGSYTDNQGQVHQGLIKNMYWTENPKNIVFKKGADQVATEVALTDINAFQIPNYYRYERHVVAVDQSLNQINSLSNQRAPIFESEDVLLKIIADGEATLYKYSDNGLLRFFYKQKTKDSDTLNPLVYKQYQPATGGIRTNNRFQQQLSRLSCTNGKFLQATKVNYREKSLVNFFNAYNECNNNSIEVTNQTSQKWIINVKAMAGLVSSSIENKIVFTFTEFPTKITPTFGGEIEILLPFDNNKWGVFTGVNTMNYEAETDIPFLDEMAPRRQSVSLSVLNASIGLRHYLHLNDHHSLILNASYGFELSTDYEADSSGRQDIVRSDSGTSSFQFGLGYSYKRFGIEARFFQDRDHLGEDFPFDISEYSAIMLNLSYKFLSF